MAGLELCRSKLLGSLHTLVCKSQKVELEEHLGIPFDKFQV